MTKRRIQGREKAKVLICILAVLLCSSYLFAAEQATASGAGRYSVFSLKHISAEQGKKYLVEAGVGVVSQLPGVNALLVTAQAEELVKASAIIELVDTEELFDIRVITSASDITHFPLDERIAAELGDISIGTFSDPPSGAAKPKAIIDVHNGAVIAVAPTGQIERIISVIEQIQSGGAQTPQGAESNSLVVVDEVSGREVEKNAGIELAKAEAELRKVTDYFKAAGQDDSAAAGIEDHETNELFDRLINSIAETSKEPVLQEEGEGEIGEITADEQVQRPNQPKTFATIAETNKPDELESVELEKPEESTPQDAEEYQEPNLADVEELESELDYELLYGVHSYEPAPLENGNEMLELDLPEKLNIIDLVDLVGKYLQLDYMYDSGQVKGEVALKLQGPIKVKDLYPLLESVLKFRGFVMTRKGNLVTIVPAAEALGIDPILHPEEGDVQFGDVVITRLFNLNYISTTSAQNLLVSMKLGANISPIPETGTLIVTEYAYRMARVEELLEMVDQPGEPREFKFRQLKYTMATTLAPKVKTLAEQLGTVSVTISAPSPKRITRRRGESRSAFRARQRRQRRDAATAKAPSTTEQPGVYLDADERTNRILMIGLEDELAVVESLIDSLDVEQQDLRTLRLYDIQHVGAEEVVKKLGELGIIGGGGRVPAAASGKSRPAKPGTPATEVTSDEGEPLVEEPQVVVIESTNSLLINATPEQHIRIATIISYVDSETLTQAIPYVIYGLENQSPEDLAEVLQQLIQETIKDKEGKIQQTVKKIEEDIIIVPDENTFSIIVYASKKNQEWIGSLIKQLDKRRPQVLIDVTLVEISKTEAFAYDLDAVESFPNLLNTSGVFGGAGGTVTSEILDKMLGTVFDPCEPHKRVIPSRNQYMDFSVSGGLGKGFYADDHVHALLTAMQSKNYGRIMAKPKILVNDNETGTIKTTDTTYVKKTGTILVEGGTSQTTTDYTPYNAGITLEITPHISEGDLLRLEITMARSDFRSTEATESKPPDTTSSDIVTVVTVPDGSTIILGGLLKLNQGKGGSKVPLLGDIPLVGGLFRDTSNSDLQTKLYVFLKAEILRPSEAVAGLPELERISNRSRSAFEDYERRFQEYQDWPGAEPEPMDPLRVLDSE